MTTTVTARDEPRFGSYDFGLSADEERRAARLHADSIVIDLLFQGPAGRRAFTPEMTASLLERDERSDDLFGTVLDGMDLPVRRALDGRFPAFRELWDASGVTAGNRQVEVGSSTYLARLFGIAQAQFDRLPWLRKALTADDIREAKAEGEHAGFLTTQLTTGPFDSLELLDATYDLGLRMVQLTYNTMSTIGAGCTERTDAGVSRFGAGLIERMNELGIIVDTGHCGRQTTLDACVLSERPVVASHTAAAGVHPHARNKDDEELEAIAATGGVVGVVMLPAFLGDGPLTVEAALDHVDHIAARVGVEHVAIGSDWPMQLPDEIVEKVMGPLARRIGFREQDRVGAATTLGGFDDYRDFPNVTRGLVARGYSDDEVRGVLGGNFLRVFEAVCG